SALHLGVMLREEVVEADVQGRAREYGVVEAIEPHDRLELLVDRVTGFGGIAIRDYAAVLRMDVLAANEELVDRRAGVGAPAALEVVAVVAELGPGADSQHLDRVHIDAEGEILVVVDIVHVRFELSVENHSGNLPDVLGPREHQARLALVAVVAADKRALGKE